jgi:hypothetical protein
MKIGGLTVSHHAAFCHLMPGIKKHGWIYILLELFCFDRVPVHPQAICTCTVVMEVVRCK